MKVLPENWDSMPLGSLWDALNDLSRHGTPQSSIDALLYCVRERDIAALKEPRNIERTRRLR